MKTHIISAVVCISVLFIPGCSSFLEEHSPDRIPLEQAITNEEEAVQFLYGIYAKVKNTVFGLEYLSVTDMMTDDIDYTGGAIVPRALARMTHDNNNKNLKTVWDNFYAVIGQCNILIDKLSAQPHISTDFGTIMIAEAKMMRAWSYFNLAELWGDVPLITLPVYSLSDNLFPARTEKSIVYSQIIKDLDEAAVFLPETPVTVSKGTGNIVAYSYPLTLTKGAAKLLLGKAYLFNRQYEDAINALAYFATPDGYNSNYELIPYYFIFDTRYKNEDVRSKEILWEIEAKAEVGYSNNINPNICPNGKVDPWGNTIDAYMVTRYQNTIPSYDLIKSYDTDDIRYRQTFRFINAAPNSIPQILKNYDIQAADPDNGGPNAILLRVADAYLMLAESYNELGSPQMASFFSSRVRERAGLQPLPETLSQEEMRDALLLERRHEFACENSYRLFDLRRTGKYGEVMKAYSQRMSDLMSEDEETLTEEFVDMATGNTTPAITIPFARINKVWQDKYMLHPIPKEELIANPNLKVNIPDWN